MTTALRPLTVAFVAKLVAKPDKADEVSGFLAGALALANQEAGTVVWFALRLGPTTFGVFSCSKATNEVNFAAQKFSRAVLGSNNIDSCNRT